MSDEVMRAGQIERGTTLVCRECGTSFAPKNKNGIPAEFCRRACLDRNRNRRRLKGAAALMERPKRTGPSRHAQQVSRAVFQSLVPVEERAALLRQAAAHLGITDPAEIERALRRNGCLAEVATA